VIQQPIPRQITVSLETAIIIILTALGLMLATLAIGCAVAAIWGYTGIKDFLKEMATKKVDEAMSTKLREYPPAADILKLVQNLQEKMDFFDQVQNQVVMAPEPNPVENASNTGIDLPASAPVAHSVAVAGQQAVTPIEPYPGERNG
jgi:hypothetical protein